MKLEEITNQLADSIEKELKEMPANLYKFDKKFNETELRDVIEKKQHDLKLDKEIVQLEIDILEEELKKLQTI